jgi:hypothetical protein
MDSAIEAMVHRGPKEPQGTPRIQGVQNATPSPMRPVSGTGTNEKPVEQWSLHPNIDHPLDTMV